MTSVIIFTAVFALIRSVLELLPSAETVEMYLYNGSDALDSFIDYIHCACYLLPMNTVQTILSIIIDLMVWRIIASVFSSLWDLLPIV